MSTNWTETLYRPVYTQDGVVASLALVSNEIITLVAIDATAGMQIVENHMDIQTIKPVARILYHDLAQLGHAPDDLENAIMELNGDSWIVKSYFIKGSPNGAEDGEIYLILNEAT